MILLDGGPSILRARGEPIVFRSPEETVEYARLHGIQRPSMIDEYLPGRAVRCDAVVPCGDDDGIVLYCRLEIVVGFAA